MQLEHFKTMWGFEGDFETACIEAKEEGFRGIEGQAPKDAEERAHWKACLEKYDLDYISEVVTGGDYVPVRHLSVEAHLGDVKEMIENALELSPHFITCLGGLDAWSMEESIHFFKEAMQLAKAHDLEIYFETHRSRILFTPWRTREITEALPQIRLTLDISHWCVVCERLMSTELETIKAIAPYVNHIHGRVGYDQGPQVPHPGAPEYNEALLSHQEVWEIIWDAQQAKGFEVTTMTPEFGPDGYLHTLPFTNAPVADLWELNCWMAECEKEHFNGYTKKRV